MTDVAALAGVSQRTVSNVVRGYVHVRPETRERVQRAIDELKYRPHASARSLREGRTGILALAVPQIATPYFAELADLIQHTAAARGYTLLIDQTSADRDRELLVLDGYASHVIDGLILSPMAITVDDLAERDLGLPTVLLGERIRGGPLVNVTIDNASAARAATEHLLGTGRRRIAAVGANSRTSSTGAPEIRLEGYRQALDDAGIGVDPELVVPTDGWTLSKGRAAVGELLDGGAEVDALLCFTDEVALGAVRAVAERGLSVPGDVGVMGWDDVEAAAYATPSLSSVSPDKPAIAESAVDQLLAQVLGQEGAVREVVCGHRVVVRESTGCPRRR